MLEIIIYTTPYCGFCRRAKELLDEKGAVYTEIDVSNDTVKREEMEARSGRRTVPQIFINAHHIGGCDELYALEKESALDELLTEYQ